MDKQSNSTAVPIVSIPAAGEAMPTYTLDDAMIDVGDVAGQIEAVYDIIHEMDYSNADGSRNATLDRLASMLRIAVQKSRQTSNDLDRIQLKPIQRTPDYFDVREEAPALSIERFMNDVTRKVEKVWADASELQCKLNLLMGDIDRCLDPNRGRVEDTTVTLMFQKRGIEATNWLVGNVWSDSDNLEAKLHAVLNQLLDFPAFDGRAA